VIAFARSHKVVLWAVFWVAALSVVLAIVVNHFRPEYTGQSWGWMMMLAALPWSILAGAVPTSLGVVIWAAGLGFNAVIATTVGWYAAAWWLKTLRLRNDA
jgi:hypothetical protein